MSDGSVEPIRVLHVDDDSSWCDLVSDFLEREHEAISVVSESRASDALDRLDRTAVDCILSDYEMPEMDGLEFLRAVRETYPDLPFILFTGKGSESVASEAVSAGVTEYVQKGSSSEQYTLLANRIERAVSKRRTSEALRESERMLSTLIGNLPGMVYRCRNEPGWPMVFVSNGCEELTGYPSVALESGDVSWGEEIIHPADREDMWETVQTAVGDGEPFEVTYRIRTKDGEQRWVWERGSGVYENGDLLWLEGFITDITPRKRREEQLHAEREFTKGALNALEDVFFVLDTDTWEFSRWNDRLPEWTGYDDEELTGMKPAELVADQDRTRIQEAMARAVETGSVTVTADVVTVDGDSLPVEFRGTRLHDEDGDLIGIGAVGRDISDRYERERELEQYRTLVENVGDPMYVLDADGEIQMANRAMCEYLGYDREEIVGRMPGVFIPEEYVKRGQEIIAELLAVDDEDAWRTWEMEAVREDGKLFSNEMTTSLLYEDGTFVGSVGVVRDITDRKERERDLERFETVVQAVGDPVYALDADGRFTFANEAFEPMTGYTASELVGEHIGSLITDESLQEGRQHIRELVDDADRRAIKFEIEVVTKDGDHIPSELHLALLPGENGGDSEEFSGTAGIIRDIEERKQREKRLEEFASVVSHDLRGPLNVVLGQAQMAMESPEHADIEKIVQSAQRMEDLIGELLTLAQQGETVGERTEVTLATLVDQAWSDIDTAGATLHSDAEGTVRADPDRLRQLLENLIRNSVEHGGTDVTVTVGMLGDRRGFYVADDGPGIPPEDRSRVFDHGYTTNEDGTGFGLAIVDRIADAHDWSVTVTESEDGGARFEFVLE